MNPRMVLQFLIFLIPGIWKFYQFSSVTGQYIQNLLPNRLLKSADPVISMHHIIRLILQQIFPIAERLLFYHPTDSGDIFKQSLPLRKRKQRETSVTDHRFIRQHSHKQLSKPCRPPDDGNMPAVYHIRRETHIDRPLFHLPHLFRNHRQVIGVVNLCTQIIPHVQRADPAAVRYFIQGILCIAFHILRLTEFPDPVKPYLPVLLFQLI